MVWLSNNGVLYAKTNSHPANVEGTLTGDRRIDAKVETCFINPESKTGLSYTSQSYRLIHVNTRKYSSIRQGYKTEISEVPIFCLQGSGESTNMIEYCQLLLLTK